MSRTKQPKLDSCVRVLRYARQEFLGLASPDRQKETIDYGDIEKVVSKIDKVIAYAGIVLPNQETRKMEKENATETDVPQ